MTYVYLCEMVIIRVQGGQWAMGSGQRCALSEGTSRRQGSGVRGSRVSFNHSVILPPAFAPLLDSWNKSLCLQRRRLKLIQSAQCSLNIDRLYLDWRSSAIFFLVLISLRKAEVSNWRLAGRIWHTTFVCLTRKIPYSCKIYLAKENPLM